MSSATVSLAALMGGAETDAEPPPLSLEDIADGVVRGGWPATRHLDPLDARRVHEDDLDRVSRTEIPGATGVARDPVRVLALLRSIARNTATRAPLTTLAGDAGISADAARGYHDALTRLTVADDVPAWNPHRRSRDELRTAPVRMLADPSLSAAALRATPAGPVRDLRTFGLLFEALVIRDLRVYAQPLGGEVRRYRDKSGLEVDAVSTWAAFEIKLGTGQVDAAARSLTEFRTRIDLDARGEPALLGVIVGGGPGYVRDDGVHVIPVGALGP